MAPEMRVSNFSWGNTMFKNTLFVVMGSLVALSAFSADMANVAKSIPLEDGSTVYVFKNGKMGMEDKLGRSKRMKPGHLMKTKDGGMLTMVGDEVMRVESLRMEAKGGGN